MQAFVVVITPGFFRYLVYAKDGRQAMANAKQFGGHAQNAAASAEPLTVAYEKGSVPATCLLVVPGAGFYL